MDQPQEFIGLTSPKYKLIFQPEFM